MIGRLTPIVNPNPNVTVSGTVNVSEVAPITISGPSKTLLLSKTGTVITATTFYDINTVGMHRIYVSVAVTALSGTTPAMQPTVYLKDLAHNRLQAVGVFPSFVGGTDYFENFGPDMPQAPGQANPPVFASNFANFPVIITDTMRVVMFVSGTTPSITFDMSVYGEEI